MLFVSPSSWLRVFVRTEKSRTKTRSHEEERDSHFRGNDERGMKEAGKPLPLSQEGGEFLPAPTPLASR